MDSHAPASGEVFGHSTITQQYHDRDRLPVMHAEPSLAEGPEAERWLWQHGAKVLKVRNKGVPIVGFTWYSLTDRADRGNAFREPRGHVLPAQNVCLQVPGDTGRKPVG